jgi:peptide chain release factor subunit 1
MTKQTSHAYPSSAGEPRQALGVESVLILTPVKDAVRHLERYWINLDQLTYPAEAITLGILESDSTDGTFEGIQTRLNELRGRYKDVGLWQKHFGFRMPDGLPRWSHAWQLQRRRVLAKSRNHLLFRALAEHDWVLWLDVDVVEYPPDLLERMIATGRSIVHPHCVHDYGGPTFDRNGWREHGRIHMDALRNGPDLVRLDSVGGTVLLVRADIHRDGLIFPAFPYGAENSAVRRPGPWGPQFEGEIETEGLGIMAIDMGHQCWGMPNLEVLHAKE